MLFIRPSVSNTEGMDALLTPREVDQLLRYPRGRATRLARVGKLPAVIPPDGEIRFDPEAIEHWLHEHTIDTKCEVHDVVGI